jgi:hypothetical protein
VRNTFVVLLLLTFLTEPAYAYIDPGTGSFIFQGIVAAFVSGGFIIKTQFQRMKNFFTKKQSAESTLEIQKADEKN